MAKSNPAFTFPVVISKKILELVRRKTERGGERRAGHKVSPCRLVEG
jgi:hypothetical protein